MIVIGDTCTILYCVRSSLLSYLFNKYGTIHIPKAVNDELGNATSLDKMQLIGYKFEIKESSNKIDTKLDKGENEAINLYYDLDASKFLTDDNKAIKYCVKNGIHVECFSSILNELLLDNSVSEEYKLSIVKASIENKNILPERFYEMLDEGLEEKYYNGV